MRKLSQNGFSAVEALIIIIVLAILSGIGYYAYDRMNNNSESTAQQATLAGTNKQVGSDESLLDPTDFLQPYTLPEGWKENECKPGIIAINPPKSEEPICDKDQPNTTMAIFITENFDFIDPTDCNHTTSKRQANKPAGRVSYHCEAVTIDGKKGIRETFEESQESFAGESTQIAYNFPADGQLLSIKYAHREDDVHDYTTAFDAFVKTLRFR